MLVFNLNIDKDGLALKELIRFAETKSVTNYITKEYIMTLLIEDENVLSELCEQSVHIGNSLKAAAISDLSQLWDILKNDPLDGYIPSGNKSLTFNQYEQSLRMLVSSENKEKNLDELIAHYRAFGGGKNSKYTAFKWNGCLSGVDSPDDILLNRLHCLDSQKAEIMDNTKAFLRGGACENTLLYGSKGSGKSSMVKALLNEYSNDGLRLVEMPKNLLRELPALVDAIKGKGRKYIVFMDDLSFEDNDYGYKELKVILEGQIEKQPQNLLFYATSNRRHLIGEKWADRQGTDVHINETIDEKLSLSERFGLKVYFPPLNQSEYFEVIECLLSENGIPLSDKIKSDAIKWELSRGGKSGRFAARFAKSVLSQMSAF